MSTKVTTTDAIMRQISNFAPFALMVFAMLSFIAIGIFSVDYYENLFKVRFKGSAIGMAILVAVIQEAVRFGLLISSIRDFDYNNHKNGWLGLIASIGLVYHDVSLATKVADMWTGRNPEEYISIFLFLIVIGLVLELRLILTITGKKKNTQRTRRDHSKKNTNGRNLPAKTANGVLVD